MTRSAALHAALMLVVAVGCGGSKPPQTVTQGSSTDELPDEPPGEDIAKKLLNEANAEHESLQKQMRENSVHITALKDAVSTARNEEQRRVDSAKLEEAQKREDEIEEKIARAQSTIARAHKMQATQPCVDHLTTLPRARGDRLPAGDPLKSKPQNHTVFKNVKDRDAQKTQECCRDVLAAFEEQARHRWECCSALDPVPPSLAPAICKPPPLTVPTEPR